jgi:hypothetical protein
LIRSVRALVAVVLLAGPVGGSHALATGYRFTSVDGPAPNAGGTHLSGINNHGTVVGLAHDAAYNEHGFVGTPGRPFAAFGVPNSGIGFGPSQAVLSGINDFGEIIGYVPGRASFLFEIFGGELITFPVPSRLVHATALAMNDSDAIAGSFPNGPRTSGYILDVWNNLTVIDATPTALWTAAVGINNRGTVVGRYLATTPTGVTTAGYLRTPGGRITLLPTPSRIGGLAVGPSGIYYSAINDSGTTVGWFFDTHQTGHGFVRDAAGNFAVVDFPGALETFGLIGINNSGVLAGNYLDANGVEHGFLATPIPPPRP